MNYLLFLLSMITISGFIQPLNSTPSQELFLQAHELYKAKDYEKAYELYNQIPNKSARVHYNLGNCAFKLNKLGYALLHFKRAETNWGLFNKTELTHNIKLTKERLNSNNSKKEEKISFIIAVSQHCKSMTISLIRSIKLLYLQLLFLIVWFSIFVLKRWPVAKRFKYATIPLLFLLCIFGFMLAVKYGLRLTSNGIVTAPKAVVRSGPGETYQSIINVREGDEGTITKITDTYYKVAFKGKLGWINNKVFEKI